MRAARHLATFLSTSLLVLGAHAKLPAPSDDAKAKAAEAAAKTTWSNKVATYQLCKSMDQIAAHYFAQAKQAGKSVKPADAGAAACAEPGAFVYTPTPPTPPTPPLEAAGAHSPAATAVGPPNSKVPQTPGPAPK